MGHKSLALRRLPLFYNRVPRPSVKSALLRFLFFIITLIQSLDHPVSLCPDESDTIHLCSESRVAAAPVTTSIFASFLPPEDPLHYTTTSVLFFNTSPHLMRFLIILASVLASCHSRVCRPFVLVNDCRLHVHPVLSQRSCCARD